MRTKHTLQVIHRAMRILVVYLEMCFDSQRLGGRRLGLCGGKSQL